jgi:hypothetical protein
MLGLWQEFASEGRIQQVGGGDEGEEGAGQDEAGAAGPPVADLSVLPDDGRHQQQARLFDRTAAARHSPAAWGGQLLGDRTSTKAASSNGVAMLSR